MKKLIAVLVSASVMSTGALAEDAQQAASPNKSDAVMQQLADNSSTATDATAAAQDQATQAATDAKKEKKHKKHHRHHHNQAKQEKTAEQAMPAETPAAS